MTFLRADLRTTVSEQKTNILLSSNKHYLWYYGVFNICFFFQMNLEGNKRK